MKNLRFILTIIALCAIAGCSKDKEEKGLLNGGFNGSIRPMIFCDETLVGPRGIEIPLNEEATIYCVTVHDNNQTNEEHNYPLLETYIAHVRIRDTKGYDGSKPEEYPFAIQTEWLEIVQDSPYTYTINVKAHDYESYADISIYTQQHIGAYYGSIGIRYGWQDVWQPE